MGRKVKARPSGMFVKRTDWSKIESVSESRKLYWEAVTENKIRTSRSDWIRFWIAREVALAKGEHPERLFLWLLSRPEEPLPQWAEDQAMQTLRGARVTTDGPETAKIGSLLARY